MTAPRFVHLRLHSEFSIVDGTVRIDDAIAAARADAMPALAVTDLANVFGLVKFYRAARAQGIKPIVGCDVWLTHDAERDQPFRALLLAQSRAGYLQARRLADARVPDESASRPRGAEARVVRGRHRRPDRAFGRARGRGRQRAAAGQCDRRRQGGPRVGASVSRTLLPRGAARRPRRRQRARRRDGPSRGEVSLPVVATHPVQFLRREDFRAHEARVCIADGNVLADPAPREALHARAVFQDAGGDGGGFADLPEALANSVAIAQRCNLTIPLGKNFLPDFPTPPGVTLDEHLRNEAAAGLERRLAVLYPDSARATRSAANTRRASTSRRRPSCRWASPATS